MADTKIEWATKVWNPVTGCTKVSQGCKNCYAERMFGRNLPGMSGQKFTDVRCHEDRLDVPLHWRKPQRIFVNSMSDLFHDAVPVRFITEVFNTAAACPQSTFLILTKRAAQMQAIINEDTEFDAANYWPGDSPISIAFELGRWPLPNVWLGVSVEDQKAADERIPYLMQTRAAVRFLSCEPLLGPVNLSHVTLSSGAQAHALRTIECEHPVSGHVGPIHWVICGGESGPNARPMQAEWAQSLRDQCVAADVPFFFKQWGEYLPPNQDGNPEYSRGQHLNCSNETVRVGKHAAGCLLDNVEWKQFPAVQA